jgi:DNA repair protein RadA
LTTSDSGSGNFGLRSKVTHTNKDNRLFRSAADEFSEQQKKAQRFSTGSKHLDHLLGGGLETGHIIQFYGCTSGKTHLCHLLCAVSVPEFNVIYIDTEGGFRGEKIESITKARRLDSTVVLHGIQVAQPKDIEEQERCIEAACSAVATIDSKIKLLIVDSMTFHYRGKYPGRSGLSERAHRLNVYMHMLHKTARSNKCVVVITNQSTSDPRHREEPAQPLGGKVISNTSAYIIRLERRRFSNIIATLVKAPLMGARSYGPLDHDLKIVESGFEDLRRYYPDGECDLWDLYD